MKAILKTCDNHGLPISASPERGEIATSCCRSGRTVVGCCLLTTGIILGCLEPAAHGDVPIRRRAVDVFLLKDGTRLLGVLLTSADQSVTRIMCRRNWLAENAPQLLEAAADNPLPQPENTDDGRKLLVQLIEERRESGQVERERIGYLEERLHALFPEDKEPNEPTVVILELPKGLIRTQVLKRRSARQTAGVAILNDLPQSELAEPSTLAEELAGADAASLIRSLPSTGANAREAARQQVDRILLNADRLLGKTCRLILLNGQYISESTAGRNTQQLAAQMLTGQIQSQLQQLLSEDFALPAGRQPNRSHVAPKILPDGAVRLAEQEDADVVEVASLDLNAATGSSTVQLTLYHRGSVGQNWVKVIEVTGRAGTQDINPEGQQQIANDPRVQQVTQLLNGLGAGQQHLAQAISTGAVVEVAQQRAKAELADALAAGLTPAADKLKILESRITRLHDTE